MTSMEISEERRMGAETVPSNDEAVERAVADTGNDKGD